MSKKKKVILVLLGAFVLIAFVYLLFSKKEEISPQPTPSPVPQAKELLNLLQVLPPEGKNQTLFTKTGILFTFDNPLDLSSAEVDIEPTKDIIVDLARDDPKTLVIRPADEWIEGIAYTITIKKRLSSNNKELKEDLVYRVEFEIPENINPPSSEF